MNKHTTFKQFMHDQMDQRLVSIRCFNAVAGAGYVPYGLRGVKVQAEADRLRLQFEASIQNKG
jgi:hypothetical protein